MQVRPLSFGAEQRAAPRPLFPAADMPSQRLMTG